jgi:hypothetical protein
MNIPNQMTFYGKESILMWIFSISNHPLRLFKVVKTSALISNCHFLQQNVILGTKHFQISLICFKFLVNWDSPLGDSRKF